ncbi:MAG TPA: hypothetical protein VL221_02080 [Bacteroidota bacterium]|nr:hypothetical protein [Bacteroidota bacterium]
MTRDRLAGAVLLFLCAAHSTTALAGPPFKTDDPEPVDLRHWEFYLASVGEYAPSASSATLPHIEVNYGAFPDVQLHIVAPMGFARSAGATNYGYSDTELGVKYRFIEESDGSPQIGVFPLLEVPTGDRQKQLGEGSLQAYLPVWVQKSWGKFTTYAGAGYWISPGSGNRNSLFSGWEAQYDISETLTLGGELYYQSPVTEGGSSTSGFNLGGFINIDEHNHILYSIGHSFSSGSITTAYLGFQYTV